MKLISVEDLQKYQKTDTILTALQQCPANDVEFTSHRWLNDSLPKRMVFQMVYGDLLAHTNGKKILDVGGGYTGLTRTFLKNTSYTLLDIMAHDDHAKLKKEEEACGKNFWIASDWLSYDVRSSYDIVIANDLFPNVDQRLEMFLEKYLPWCSSVRLSLTFYNVSRSYKVKRVDADEIFFMLAWDGIQLVRVLEKYAHRIHNFHSDILTAENESLFPNKRQICVVEIQGDRNE